MYFSGRKPPPDKMNFQFFRHLWMAKLYEVKTEAPEEKLPTHKDNISNYRSSSIEKATDSELFRVSGFSLKTRLHSGTIYVYKRNFS